MSPSNSRSMSAGYGYDPRWFIWTIVFLVATGISLVSYILLSDTGTNDVPVFAASKVETHKK